MLGVDLYEDAGRAAYLAAFHAAQALIAERTARSMKTHRGVHSEFARLTRDDAFDSGLRTFLSRAYEFKSTADYDVGPDAFVPPEKARDAVNVAKTFVAAVAKMISDDRPQSS